MPYTHEVSKREGNPDREKAESQQFPDTENETITDRKSQQIPDREATDHEAIEKKSHHKPETTELNTERNKTPE